MTPPTPGYRVLLIGNYRLDRQMSMLRYYDMLLLELGKCGLPVSGIAPAAYLGRISAGPFTKWLRYLDKYLLFPFALKKRLAAEARAARAAGHTLIVHTTDHSNAPYLKAARPHRLVATCHDLLAVRGALGEDTDCPASGFGKILQRHILDGLRQAHLVLCVSSATRSDLARLAPHTASCVIPLPLNQPYAVLSRDTSAERLTAYPALLATGYLLHVGSSLPRKNRAGILRIFAKIADRFPGQLVFAGEKLPPDLHALAAHLGIAQRLVEIKNPPGSVIEALYNRAYAFLFPSKTEGFGWPIIEAQACGCPVLVARTTSLPEVVGAGGLLRDLADEDGFAHDLLTLENPAIRSDLIAKGHQNLTRFSTDHILSLYLAAYQDLV